MVSLGCRGNRDVLSRISASDNRSLDHFACRGRVMHGSDGSQLPTFHTVGFLGCLRREKYSLIFRSCRGPSEGNWRWFGGNGLFLRKEAKQLFDLALLMWNGEVG